MKSVGIVSCDKWQNKIKEDLYLQQALQDLGIEAEIISWQKPLNKHFDLLILRSIWGYQNEYENFKKWLLYVKKVGIPLFNDSEMVLKNILKDKQFEILERHGIATIKTNFLDKERFSKENISNILEGFNCELCVLKPSISGSGENTYVISKYNKKANLPNLLSTEEIFDTYYFPLCNNKDLKIMFQPYISQIQDGEYSCIFIDGDLTHTMLRFPNIFHEKKSSIFIEDPPKKIIELALLVEKIPEFKDYLYMRVDMVLIDGTPYIMEVELTDPDLLTKYIDNTEKKDEIVRLLAKKIKRRT